MSLILKCFRGSELDRNNLLKPNFFLDSVFLTRENQVSILFIRVQLLFGSGSAGLGE
mgnify:CR=1 FL=1